MGKTKSTRITCPPASDPGLIGNYRREDHAYCDEAKLVAEFLAEGISGIMIDVGAHHGSALAPFLDRGWRVYAFEPDPDNRKRLLARYGHNPLLSVDSRAVSDKADQSVAFYSSSESTGISTLTPFRDTHQKVCQVCTTRLLDFCRDNEIKHVDFLKTDTEGYDFMVLKGFPWETVRPSAIQCEFEDRKTLPLGYNFHDMARFLMDKGYTVFVSEWHPVIRYGIRHDWRRLVPYPCQLVSPDAWGNLIAFKNPPTETELAAIARRLVLVAGKTAAQREQAASAEETPTAMDPRSQQSRGWFIMRRLAAVRALFIRGNQLLYRVGRFYLGWPGMVAVSALAMYGLALKETPYGWALAAGGALLILFLIGSKIASVVLHLDKLHESTQQVRQELKSIAKLYDEFIRKANNLNAALYQCFSRQLRAEDLDRLTTFWLPALGLDRNLDRRALGYLAHRICLAEDTCSGRLAASVQAGLLRVLVARSVPNDDLEILEIGTLFGLNLAISYETCRDCFRSIHMTAIDPLEGYYSKGLLDDLTKMPVTASIFEHNMRRMDVPRQNVTLIKARSTDERALQHAAERQYDLLMIDGDHSYQGIKFDFDHYHSLVGPGGYILFDNYDAVEWPDVKAFIDQEVRPRSDLEFIGADWRTFIFRRRKG